MSEGKAGNGTDKWNGDGMQQHERGCKISLSLPYILLYNFVWSKHRHLRYRLYGALLPTNPIFRARLVFDFWGNKSNWCVLTIFVKYYDYGACMNKDDTILQCVFSTHLTNLYCILVCQWLSFNRWKRSRHFAVHNKMMSSIIGKINFR